MRKVIHVELLNPAPGRKRHYYFGSKAAIYEELTSRDLGISYDSLRSHAGGYQNAKCIIRQGYLIAKPGRRGVR
ncbi:MAG: hypothetical protein MJZ81_06285 [Bacteroidales bacterium]|nr:hypothetical protein [Bacteroidales bacterium]